MKHDWENTNSKDKFGDMNNYGRRRCRNCQVEQTKNAQHLWMRVTGYRWEPLAGRCKGQT
jgi:hypothetical protein